MMLRREFDWDPTKARSNLDKHGMPFDYATRVFLDPSLVELDTSRPTDRERRMKAIGAVEGRVFSVVYTMRGNTCRIISARRCNAKEERAYGPVHPGST